MKSSFLVLDHLTNYPGYTEEQLAKADSDLSAVEFVKHQQRRKWSGYHEKEHGDIESRS